ncbi:MAG: DUF6361 family protein [Dehalococcoidia bacterium]
MSSTLSWLDYSEEDRRRIQDAVDLFRQPDTRDALGLGSIRDGFADLLSPGTSTIQTRARYFLLIPWLCLWVERSGSSKPAAARARAAELNLVEALVEAGDLEGLIGRQARRNLKRLPSDVYWQGLEAWAIRRVGVSRDAYYRWIDDGLTMWDTAPGAEGEESGIWHGGLPEPPPGFPGETSLSLAPAEADYLAERVLTYWPRTLLASVIRDNCHCDGVDFPWLLPELAQMPAAIQQQVEHGRCFSETIFGAQLLYNLMLARKRHAELDGPRGEVDRWEEEIEEWEAAVADRSDALHAWDLEGFWAMVAESRARVSSPTAAFITRWIDHVRAGIGALDIATDARCRDWVHDQECRVKGKQARLVNRTMLIAWGGESGAQPLNYRWNTTKGYAEEIGRVRGV